MDRILIVDDMQQNIDLMSAYLENSGYEVFSANNGSQALKKAKMLQPFLVVLDLIMPGISGYEICRRLKEEPSTSEVLVLIVTALDSKDSRKKAFEIGADDFLVKPFDKGTLKSKIKSLFRLKHMRDELSEQYKQIEKQNEMLQFQLKMARQVQRALIDEHHMNMNNVNIQSRYLPAMDIGGDMYDVVSLNEHCLGIFMADVSGHGISAALLTAMLKMMFQNSLRDSFVPSELLKKMNQEFSSVFSSAEIDMYACAVYAIINTQTKRVTYSNAGHAFPVFVDSSEDTAVELTLGGVPLGMMEDSTYQTQSFYYESGDMLLFHTDGLCDAFYKEAPEEFMLILKKLLLDMKEDGTSEEILQGILDYFYDFEKDDNRQYSIDDVSLILCQM